MIGFVADSINNLSATKFFRCRQIVVKVNKKSLPKYPEGACLLGGVRQTRTADLFDVNEAL